MVFPKVSRSQSLEPVKITLYGKTAFVSVIKFKILENEQIIRVGPKYNHV